MSPLWKKLNRQQKRNHHFPELAGSFKLLLWRMISGRLAMVALLLANLLVGFFYLTQTNRTATYGYEIKSRENELTRLQEENKRLNLDYIRLQSMAEIEAKLENLNLVPADNVETLSIGDGPIALNRN
jgi:hypothetical protein